MSVPVAFSEAINSFPSDGGSNWGSPSSETYGNANCALYVSCTLFFTSLRKSSDNASASMMVTKATVHT